MAYLSPMRALLAFLLTALPAQAWEAGVDGRLCTLTHAMPGAQLRLTHDPAIPEYAIHLTRPGAPWPDAPVFAMRFDGARPNTISTSRHVLDPGGTTLSVTDRGFGNVLDGLEFNHTATALAGADSLEIPLAGAAPEVAAFRACTVAPTA